MSQTDTYLEEVPENVDMSQDEWEELGYHGQYYRANNKREQKRKQRKERRARKRGWLDDYKSSRSCEMCSEDEPVCLDFHHIKDKKYNVGRMPNMDKPISEIEDEIDKCVLLCANCHRKVHGDIIDVTERFK
jgi:hypothetical protein